MVSIMVSSPFGMQGPPVQLAAQRLQWTQATPEASRTSQGAPPLRAVALVAGSSVYWSRRIPRHRRRRSRQVRWATDKDEEEQNPLKAAIGFISGVAGSILSMWDQKPEADSNARTSREGEARLVQQLGRTPIDAQRGVPIYSLGPFPKCTAASDLRNASRDVTVITTAALPWTTGPSINPLLRSLYLARRGHKVILVMPWLASEHQACIYPDNLRFENPKDQERYIRKWCVDRAKMDPDREGLSFRWYEAAYFDTVKSIFPKQDNSQVLADCPKDVLVLEEPEHLCWYHNGQRWTDLYKHVVGVVHTNYQVYLEELGYAGLMSSATIRDSLFSTFTSMVCSAYCDVTIKLSSAGMSLPNEVLYNVHGVRQEFFDIARRSNAVRPRWLRGKDTAFTSQVYFIGKAVKPKGWVQLLNLLATLPDAEAWSDFQLDAFGSGPDAKEIAEMVEKMNNKCGRQIMKMSAGRNHSEKEFEQYKVLVNASTTEMLCTVTAEALAMGKRVVLPDHPSNAYFKANFDERCHFFKLQDPESFHSALKEALAQEGPMPLPAEAEARLSWESALERFYDAAQVHVLSGRLERPSEARGAKIAFELHSRFQTDTPAFSSLLKSATLNQEMEFKAPWSELGSSKELMQKLRSFTTLQQKEDFDVVSQEPRADSRELESQSSGPIPMSRKK